MNKDFEECVKNAEKGDFINFNPTYDSATSNFNSYTKTIICVRLKLKETLIQMVKKGKVEELIITNSKIREVLKNKN